MHKDFSLRREVVVDYISQYWDIYTSCGHVRYDQNSGPAGSEGLNLGLPSSLIERTVNMSYGKTGLSQELRKILNVMFGRSKNDGRIGIAGS